MNGSGTAFNRDSDVGPHQHWFPSDDALSLDESSCSTVVTDSADSDAPPSPFLLGGLQYLKRTDIGRQGELEYTSCTESDDSKSTNCSEFILDPSNRLRDLSIREAETAQTNNQNFTHNAGNGSPVISVVAHPSSEHPSPLIYQHDLREGRFNEDSSLMITGNLPGISENHDHLASHSHVVPSPHLFSGQDNSGNTCWEIDASSGCGRYSGVGGDRSYDIPSHSCSTDITDVPMGSHDSNMDSKAQDSGRPIESLEHQSAPSPGKIRKLSDGSERGSYLSDSVEDVTQVDGSACMFSDSSPVKSSSDHLLLPQTHVRNTSSSEEEIRSKEPQQHVETTVVTIDHQTVCESNDMPFGECQNTNCCRTESYLSGGQLGLEKSPQTQPLTSANISTDSTAHPEHEARNEYVMKYNESVSSMETARKELRHLQDVDALVTSRHTFKISNSGRDVRVEMEEGEGNSHEAVKHSVDKKLMNKISTNKSKLARQGRAGEPSKRGRQKMRSKQRVNEREKWSQIDGRQIEALTRSHRQSPGNHGSDILIHERILVLQAKLNKVKSGQDELTQSLSNPKDILKDVTNVGQQLRNIQTNFRQIAADVREVKSDLERSLFDLRFVYSQKKRKTCVQQEMNSVLEIQHTLWTQLKAHREIASRLQEVLQEHTKETKKTRRKETYLRIEKRRDLEESAGLTSSDGSVGSSCDGVTGASRSKEKQNTLLQQLLETLDESKGNLFVKFISMLQGRETLETGMQKTSLDLKKVSLAESSLGDVEEKGRGKMMTSVRMTSSVGEGDISVDNRYEKRLGEIEEAEAGEISRGGHDMSAVSPSSLKQDIAGSHSKLTPGKDMGAKEPVSDDERSSSGDNAAGEFMSSDDEMSVVPEPLGKLHESVRCEIPDTKGRVGGIKQVNPIGQVVPEDFQVTEGANSSITNVQLSASISSCAPTSAVELASLSAIQKAVQVSTSQYVNAAVSSSQKSASFHTPWKGLASNTKRDSSRVEVAEMQQGPSSHPSSSVALTEGYSNNRGGDSALPYVSTDKPQPMAKKQFKLITIPKTMPSGATQVLCKSHPQAPVPVVARHSAQTGQRIPGPQMVSLKAVPLMQNTTRDRFATPQNLVQPEQHHNKFSYQINSGSSSQAFVLQFKESERIHQGASLPRGFPDVFPSEDPLSCDGKTGLEETYVDNSPFFHGLSSQRDAPKQQPDQITFFPDMKLYKKIHLIDEDELMPYIDVLPQEMWAADDISLVQMPREFFDDIDSW